MREIKFRAWDKDKKQMKYNLECIWCGLSERAGFVYMQYIGLKDKNRREIYEGDIVKGAGKNPIIYVVEWLDSYGGFAFVDKEKAIPAYEFLVNFCEVIGNIYENPELLEEGKE